MPISRIYGLDELDGVRALVLELVERPTLANAIAQGPIPIDEALPIARQWRPDRGVFTEILRLRP